MEVPAAGLTVQVSPLVENPAGTVATIASPLATLVVDRVKGVPVEGVEEEL